MADHSPPTVVATLRYLARIPLYDKEKPFEAIIDLSHVPDARPTNHQHVNADNLIITDIKRCNLNPELDKEGFQLEILPDLPNPDFENPAWIRDCYYAYIKQFLQRLLSAKEVLIFEHQLRYRHPGFGDARFHPGGEFAAPVPVVHADQTKEAARRRFYRHWPGFTDSDWNQSRWQIINIWRPLNDVVTEWPLALCDCRTVDEKEDLRGSDLIRTDYVGESCLSFFNPKHAWYFASRQSYNEAWVLKLYDSKVDAASTVLHTAFDIGSVGVGGRKSCEVRALVKR